LEILSRDRNCGEEKSLKMLFSKVCPLTDEINLQPLQVFSNLPRREKLVKYKNTIAYYSEELVTMSYNVWPSQRQTL
jgi:hypothetical protein